MGAAALSSAAFDCGPAPCVPGELPKREGRLLLVGADCDDEGGEAARFEGGADPRNR